VLEQGAGDDCRSDAGERRCERTQRRALENKREETSQKGEAGDARREREESQRDREDDAPAQACGQPPELEVEIHYEKATTLTGSATEAACSRRN